MSLAFCVLGSGSAGNSTLMRLEDRGAVRYVMIDCGLSPRETARRLRALDISLNLIDAVLLTHLDRDHFYPSWARAAIRHGITLYLHREQRSRARHVGLDFACAELFDDQIVLPGGTNVEAVPFAHDQLGTVGFIVNHADSRLGFATDLGRVPPSLFNRFRDLHALALESNYDRRMQLDSARPMYLKQRIMGGRGHLSNEESLEAILRIAEQSSLNHIALLHLSRECNCPGRIRALYERCAPHLLDCLILTRQDQATPLLHVRDRRQLGRSPNGQQSQLAMFP